MNAVELERNGCFFFFLVFFFLPLLRKCCVVIEKNIDKKSLQVELVTKYDIKDAQKESLVKGSKSAKGGPNPRGVQIRCDTGS